MRSKMADAWVNQEDGPHFEDLRTIWGNPRWSGIPNKAEAKDYSLLRLLLWESSPSFKLTNTEQPGSCNVIWKLKLYLPLVLLASWAPHMRAASRAAPSAVGSPAATP